MADLIPVPSESPNALMNAGDELSSSSSSNSCSFIFLASSKSCSNEDISGDGEEDAAAGEDIDVGVVDAEFPAACGGVEATGAGKESPPPLPAVLLPVTTSRTFLTWSWTGVSSLVFSSMIGMTGAAVDGAAAVEVSSGGEKDEATLVVDVAVAVASFRFLRRFFCCCVGAPPLSSLLLASANNAVVWNFIPVMLLLLPPACC
mmetsp:Transcript_11365/g.27072  ORF Transcript_11365/g.27072 Transcript_11365/m.27072 type:complete len:203 (-) Transcript_11365:275-883(-)